MTIKVFDAHLGAEVGGLDLAQPVSPALLDAILSAWAKHLVLLFRGQALSDPQLIAFSRRLGDLDLCPPNDLGRTHIEEFPEIVVISNAVKDGKKLGSLGNYESLWHTDMSYAQVPPRASLLYSLEVPPSGGGTQFSDMYLALEKMPASLRAEIQGLYLVHDASLDSAGSQRRGVAVVSDPREAPGARHPLVRVHPATRRAALYLGRRKNAYVVGYDIARSEELLDRLWAHATQPEFAWTHHWKVGDLLLWDNRCTMHRRDSFPATSTR
ncbi:MAG TPA: TauD/TfdA family dioxygenase, partial [Ramlibacter sp.]|nr:TauD/TfdA family dioxygenase [Ramlibacter sp.]